jgi:hypothetical protein
MRTPMILLAIGGLGLATVGLAAESNQSSQSHQGLSATTTAGQTLPSGESQINLSNGCQIRFFDQANQIPSGQQQVQLNSSCK